MAYIVIKPADLVSPIDLDNFDPNCLTANARIYYDRYQSAYYTDNPDEGCVQNMEKVK